MLLSQQQIFEEAGNDRLLDKQYLLTGYLEFLIDTLEQKTGEGETKKKLVQIITPRDPKQRGTQLSVMFPVPLKDIHEQLEKRGVVVCTSLQWQGDNVLHNLMNVYYFSLRL